MSQRAITYRDGMATGVFRLIALGASRKDQEMLGSDVAGRSGQADGLSPGCCAAGS
jgi:hypothetical protein